VDTAYITLPTSTSYVSNCINVCAYKAAQHLCESVEDETEVSDGCYGGKSLLIHVTSLLYESPPDVIVC